MILNKIDTTKYKEDFTKKFNNFGEKAPIMISFAIDEFGVTIVHENSGKKYFYDWDFTIPVKAFIHKIKQDLSYNHYPRLIREIEVLDEDSAVDQILEGKDPESVENTKKTTTKEITYRIDKVLMMKDQFILVEEATGESYCYQLEGSSVYFLKNYRNGVYKNIKEAGDYFFKNAKEIVKLNK